MPWTKQQQKIIDSRDASVLVSAAAGSGKTAVLVERILTKILDKENPHNVDDFLVVTFTNAAAAQMREKIAGKLEEELIKHPENEHLAKQVILVNRADITTIDSFCLKMIKEHFSLLNIDPKITIGDNAMTDMIKNDTLDKMFEEKYNTASAGDREMFLGLLDILVDNPDEDELKKQILNIYRIASSFPEPEKWYQEAKEALRVENVEEFNELEWVKEYISIAQNTIRDALIYVKKARNICTENGGPDKNYEITLKDEQLIINMLAAKNYQELMAAINTKFPVIKPCKGDAYDSELVEKFKNVRDEYKKIIKGVNIFRLSVDDVIAQINDIGEYLIPLIMLTEEFSRRYRTEKKDKGIMEFSDVEHLAYRLCCRGYDLQGNALPTPVGEKIGEGYKEIYIDEYQDSNYLQEDILTSLSGISRGHYNMFMVGDVKQSIYRFRMARPDLFVDKYNRFQDEGKEIRVDLKNNFRSRDTVLFPINYFFYQLIGEDLGDICYDKRVALIPSLEFCEPSEKMKERAGGDVEILFVNAEPDDNDVLSEEEENTEKNQLEAKLIGRRILELTDADKGQVILDAVTGKYRPVVYKDIVILSRSLKNFGNVVYNTLTELGIPAYIEDSKGYFDSTEIKVIMSLLEVVDNVRQDIPLGAVLLSPIGRLSENEVALVCNYAGKNMGNEAGLFDKCQLYMEQFEDDTAYKLKAVFDKIGALKELKNTLSISELIWKALEITGYYTYASAMPMGEKRKGNIHMLIEKARKYEDGFYKGLFNFLRYIEKMNINDSDYGEANILSDDENLVRIMSMHKSKGLEYPVVFVSGLGREFNNMDIKQNIIVHSDYYIASMDYNREKRFKKNSFIRDCFRELIKRDAMSEELRIFYVAMTRAKEKLILTGCHRNIEKLMAAGDYLGEYEQPLLPYTARLGAKSFMDMIIKCMVRYGMGFIPGEHGISVRILSYMDIAAGEIKSKVKNEIKLEQIKSMADNLPETSYYKELTDNFSFKYPYEPYVRIKSKMSISEIKKMKAYDGESYDAVENIEIEYGDREKKISGAERGTIVHKYMELLDFEKAYGDEAYVENFANELVKRGIFSIDERSVINSCKINNMINSSLGKRMVRACKEGKLVREQQFQAGILPEKIYPELNIASGKGDVIIVQGIIDAFFYEEEEIVVMDYKTDRADEKTLVGRYRAQLDYYGDILSRLTGKRVKEKIIYSFYLDNEIQL